MCVINGAPSRGVCWSGRAMMTVLTGKSDSSARVCTTTAAHGPDCGFASEGCNDRQNLSDCVKNIGGRVIAQGSNDPLLELNLARALRLAGATQNAFVVV